MMNLHATPVAENVASIAGLRDKRLDGEPKNVLLGMARDGYDVRAYWPGNQSHLPPSVRRWKLWINGHSFEIDEWLADFNA